MNTINIHIENTEIQIDTFLSIKDFLNEYKYLYFHDRPYKLLKITSTKTGIDAIYMPCDDMADVVNVKKIVY